MIQLILTIALSSAVWADMPLPEYLQQAPQPLDAQLTVNEQNSVDAAIGEAGGTLELTTSDGSVFHLTIPAGALDHATPITISEVAAFANPAFALSQPAVGVQLSPEGLLFQVPASLKIQPKKPIALDSLALMTAEHDGKDVRLATLDPQAPISPEAIVLSLSHFSPYVLTGSSTLREQVLKSFNRLSVARLESWTADQIQREKQGKPHDPEILKTALTEAFEKVVKVHVGSVESCDGGMAAMRTLLGWERQCQLLGIDLSDLQNNNFNSALVSKTAKLCSERARDACYRDHRPFDVMRFALGVERQAQLLGVPVNPNAAELMELARKCMRFEFQMHSTISTDDPGEIKVTADAKILAWLDTIYDTAMQSKGTVQVTDMTLNIEGLHCTRNSLDAPEAESSLVSVGVKDLRFDQSLGVFIRGLYPRSIGHFMCTDESDPPNTFPMTLPMMPSGPNDSFWGGMFLAMHSQATKNEYNPKENRYEFYKWDVLYGELFAVKEYDRSFDLLREKTTMKVFHRPQQ